MPRGTCPAPYFARFSLALRNLGERSLPVTVERVEVVRDTDDALLIDMPSADIAIDGGFGGKLEPRSTATLSGGGRSVSEYPGSGDGSYKTRMQITTRVGDASHTVVSDVFDAGWGHMRCP